MLKLVNILLKNGLKKEPFSEHTSSSISYSVIDAVDSIYLLDSEASFNWCSKRKVMQRIYKTVSYTKPSVIDSINLAYEATKSEIY
jgi:hypothetical protein